MGVRVKIYNHLVNRVPGIQQRYLKKRESAQGKKNVAALGYLLKLNVSYYLLRDKKLLYPEEFPIYEEKELSVKPESELLDRESPKVFAERLSEDGCFEAFSNKSANREPLEAKDESSGECSIVSFDVFDTLVFRPFSEPSDLFYLIGERIGYPDFRQIRREEEQSARQEKYRQEGHYEVTLDEIYERLEKEAGIDRKRVQEIETGLEKQLCYANPYMLQVVEELRKRGKRLIVTSDIYLSKKTIREILQHCGYPEFDAYYISCEIGKSKSNGDLYEYVQRTERHFNDYGKVQEANPGKDCQSVEGCGVETGISYNRKDLDDFQTSGQMVFRMIHVGDNEYADIKKAEKNGITAIHYKNVNQMGKPYRPYDMSVLTGSLYRGTVNAHIYNGIARFTREYEYGYIYGGLFVTGYCQFIHSYVQAHGTEKILFLARDGDVLSKAYGILYPQEKNWEYVYWSRLAATKLAAGTYKYDYFRRFLYHRMNQGYGMEQIFSSMELGDMLENCCAVTGIAAHQELTSRNADRVKRYLMEHWPEVLVHYEEQVKAARQYYLAKLAGVRSAVAVDIGWAGSGALALDHMVNHVWNMNCKITGIVAGTNTCHTPDADATEPFLQSGKLVSYLFSQRENRDIWKLHDPNRNHNLYWETLLSAKEGSLKGFYLDENGQWECRFKQPETDAGNVRQIQEGILSFVRQWKALAERLGDDMAAVSGRDAYAPMVNVESRKNKAFCEMLKALSDDRNL